MDSLREIDTKSRLGRVARRVGAAEVTEMLALLLRAEPRFASEFLEWLDRAPQESDTADSGLVTRTEAPTGRGSDAIDLEVLGPSTRIWIEVKRNESGESGHDQLERYYEALGKKTEQNKALIYLTRPSHPSPANLAQSPGFDHRTWHELGSWLDGRSANSRFISDFVKFLKEDRLLIPPVTDIDLKTLSDADAARRRFTELLGQTERVVRDRFDDGSLREVAAVCMSTSPTAQSAFRKWTWDDGGYCNYLTNLVALDGSMVYLEWDLLGRNSIDPELPEAPLFGAGVTLEPVKDPDSFDWRARVAAQLDSSVRVLEDRSSWWHLYELWTPQSVLESSPAEALESQANQLASQITAAWKRTYGLFVKHNASPS